MGRIMVVMAACLPAGKAAARTIDQCTGPARARREGTDAARLEAQRQAEALAVACPA